MDAPKCRMCGKKEWGHVCGEEPDKVASEVESKDEPASGPDDVVADRLESHRSEESSEVRSEGEGVPLTQSQRNARYRSKNRAAYNAYMRDYRRRVKAGEK